MDRLEEDFWVEIADWDYHLSAKGYAVIFAPECPLARPNGQIYRCRYVAWAFGKLIDPTDTVHHRDRVKLNDHPDNLEIMSRKAHGELHGATMPLDVRAKIAAKRRGWVWSPEMRAKLSVAHKGQRLSEEAKRKLSEANTGRKITWGDKLSKALKGRRPSDACMAARLESMLGKSLSEEHRRKVSESLKRYRASLPNVNAERDARIRELRSQGKTLRVIGAEVGLTQASIHRILAVGKGEVNHG